MTTQLVMRTNMGMDVAVETIDNVTHRFVQVVRTADQQALFSATVEVRPGRFGQQLADQHVESLIRWVAREF